MRSRRTLQCGRAARSGARAPHRYEWPHRTRVAGGPRHVADMRCWTADRLSMSSGGRCCRAVYNRVWPPRPPVAAPAPGNIPIAYIQPCRHTTHGQSKGDASTIDTARGNGLNCAVRVAVPAARRGRPCAACPSRRCRRCRPRPHASQSAYGCGSSGVDKLGCARRMGGRRGAGGGRGGFCGAGSSEGYCARWGGGKSPCTGS